MKPAFSISVGGADFTGRFADRLLSLTVTDQEGSESDSVSIEVDDRDGVLAIPRKGDTISVSMGYSGLLVPMGLFIVDQVSVKGWPRTMSITGRAADLRETFKQQRSGKYENKTMSDIIGEVVKRHGLQPKCFGSIASFKSDYLSQTEESDLHFITRLAKKHDCVATAKGGKLIFVKKGEGDLGMATIVHPGDLIEYEATFQDRPAHKKTGGHWWDRVEVKRKREEGDSGDEGPNYEIQPIWPDGTAEAKEVAKSKGTALQRDTKTANFEVVGNPTLMAEMKLMVVGVRAGVDGLYRIKTAEHRLDNSGYVTKVTCELPGGGGGNE